MHWLVCRRYPVIGKVWSIMSKQPVSTSSCAMVKAIEDLEKNPYFEKYAEKIAKLQKWVFWRMLCNTGRFFFSSRFKHLFLLVCAVILVEVGFQALPIGNITGMERKTGLTLMLRWSNYFNLDTVQILYSTDEIWTPYSDCSSTVLSYLLEIPKK